jgi:two-component system sensor histidine kinase DegS
VYRLAQECLNNVARHSGASKVMVSLDSADKILRLRVEDDGAGFPVEQVLAKRDSFGVAGMKERVALFGGRLVVRSRPKQGTKVLVELPVD